jgi:hypothetical protein
MNFWHIMLWVLAIAGIAGSLYGLHRLCLWLEERGWLYYKHKRASTTAAGCFVALQQALEPQSQHVLYVGEEKRHHSDEEAPADVPK